MLRHVGRGALFCALVGFSLALVGCAQNDAANNLAISGRSVGLTNAFPGVVELFVPGNRLCSGAIVSRFVVMTAGHCADQPGEFQVTTTQGTFVTEEEFDTGCTDVSCTNDLAFVVFDEPIAVEGQDQIFSIGGQVNQGDLVNVVGWGCTSTVTLAGTGQERAGTNTVAFINGFVNLLTPKSTVDNSSESSSTDTMSAKVRVMGDATAAGTCFGDSGAPLLKQNGNSYVVVATVHAGGDYDSNTYLSEFINDTTSSNMAWMQQINSEQNLQIVGL